MSQHSRIVIYRLRRWTIPVPTTLGNCLQSEERHKHVQACRVVCILIHSRIMLFPPPSANLTSCYDARNIRYWCSYV